MHRKIKALQSRVEDRAVEGARTFTGYVESGEICNYVVIGQTRKGDMRVFTRGAFERNLLAGIGACKYGADILNDMLKNSLFEDFGERDPVDRERDT